MNWQIVPERTHIHFAVRHMLVSKVRGSFSRFSGTVDYDEKNPAHTTVLIRIDVASIDTGDKQRDRYLRSDGFLNAAEYPALTFVSKHVQPINSRYGRLTGDLTIQNRSHEVMLKVRRIDNGKSAKKKARAVFQASTTINRKAWNLEWNAALEAGGWLVGDKININIELEIVKIED